MKIHKFLMASLLLAIITIGAVSAADNMTQNDAFAAESDSSNTLVGEYYSDDDFYITVQENYTQDKSDWNSNDLIYISSYSQDNGTFSILVDDVEKQSLKLTNGYFSIEDDGYGGSYEKYFSQIYPDDLGLDLGNYNVKVNFNQKTLIDASVTLKQKEDFDIYMQNTYYCEEEYWTFPSFITIDSNHANTGTLEILVNGNRKVSYAVNNGSFEEIADCSNRSRYLAASDLLDGYGTYDIKITFTENGITRTLTDEKVTLAEFEPTSNPKLEVYFDLNTVHLPEDDIAHIYLPREATGTLTITFNNVNQKLDYSKGQASYYIHAWDLNHLGENEITVTYTGDDFGTLTDTQTVIVVPTITAPAYVSANEKFTITMCTHEWVDGDFNVYDYNSGKKGKLLATSRISNRYSTVELSSDVVGLNKFYLEFDYPGGDYPLIQEVYVVENSENISVYIPDEVEAGLPVNIIFKAPESLFTFVYISVDGKAYDYYMVENGQFTTNISDLSPGYHKISVQYNDGDYVDSKLIGEVYSNTFTVNVGVKTNIEANNVTTDYKSSDKLVLKLKDINGNVLAGRNVTVSLNGVDSVVVSDGDGQTSMVIDLLPGNYSADISFAGDAAYLSSFARAEVCVNKLATVLSASDVSVSYGDEANLVVSLKSSKGDALAAQNILISINGVNKTVATDGNGQARLPLDYDAGHYQPTISFAGDEKYLASSATANIDVNKLNTQLSAPDISTTYKNAKNLVVSLKDEKGNVISGKTVTVVVNGKTYNETTDSNGQVIVSLNLPVKTYIAEFSFDGDNNYLNSTGSAKVVVNKATPKITASSKTFKAKAKTKKVTLTLKDNKKKVIKKAKVTLKVNKKTYNAKTNSKGVATFTVKLTKKGKYNAVYKYGGNSNFKSATKKVKITIK